MSSSVMTAAIPLYGSDPNQPVRITGVWSHTAGITAFAAIGADALYGPLTLLLAPFVFIIALRILQGRRAVDVADDVALRARRDFTQALGRPPVQADFSAAPSKRRKSIVATGLAYDGERLYAIEESLAEPIAWKDIRRFRWAIEADQAVHVHVDVHAPGATPIPDFGARQMAQARRDAAALLRSGFFLEVADIDRPVRQFVTNDKAVLQRWYEILTQMKEGRLPVA